MFERFTPPARRVVVLAQEEARQLQHNYIGTEHVLLGLISGEPGGLPARVLGGIGLTLDEARQEVVAVVGRGKATPTGHIPFTPRAKKTLELALREALQLHHKYIGSEHILLGVIREGKGVAAQVLRNHADLAVIRQEVIEALPPGGDVQAAGRWWLRRRSADDLGELGEPGGSAEQSGLSATPAADTTLSHAARLAGARPVGSHHLLLAALSDSSTAAARALDSLGVDLEQAREALRTVDVTGTSDEQPEEAGRRQMVIRVTGGKLTLEATDPVLVKAAFAAAGALGDEAHPADTIRGDAPECASLGIVWRALRESLDVIAEQGLRPQARLIQGRRRPEAGETSGPDTPDTPGTETA
jgi:ATP-dependent Clp protease ATP-binding subunit ClpA